MIKAGFEREQVIKHPPLLCIEVLSKRDRLGAMRARIQDFLDMGVPAVWIFDPAIRTAYVCTNGAMTEHKQGTLKLAGSQVELDVEAVFATLDE